jgi:hypothetical protein
MTMKKMALSLAVASISMSAFAQLEDASLKTFSANTPAKAAEVNQNFTVLKNGINAIASTVAALSDRVVAIEEYAPNQSVAGRCYRVTGYETELARENNANSDNPYSSAKGYVHSLQVRNGYVFFDAENQTGRISVRRDTVNQYFLESGGGNFTRADEGEAGDYINTEYMEYNITWSQTNSSVVTQDLEADEGVETISFTSSKSGDILFGTEIETNGYSSGSKSGEVRLYLLNEMACSEALQGDAALTTR